MAERSRLGVALLAAGSSRRFGKDNKLAANFKGRPLGEHAAAALPMERFASGWVITSHPTHRCKAFWRERFLTPVVNDKAEQGMGSSVALAATLARKTNCDALLITLADMPFVPRIHFEALLDEWKAGRLISASGRDGVHMPPAIFDAAHFVQLQQSCGDKGARDLLALSQIVRCPPDWLIDIDTLDDFRMHGQDGYRARKPEGKGE